MHKFVKRRFQPWLYHVIARPILVKIPDAPIMPKNLKIQFLASTAKHLESHTQFVRAVDSIIRAQ